MMIIPAIDLREGRCVRLLEGRADRATVYSDDPLTQAKIFLEAGAKRIHVVDLDGAFEGEPKNAKIIEAIAKVAEIEVGGGLRDRDRVARVFAAGARSAMLGTMLAEQPELFRALCAEFPGRIVASIDARDGVVATRGWVKTSALSAEEAAKFCAEVGAAAIVHTDIARDGTGRGLNVEATAALANAVGIPVIASGGVNGLEDLRALSKTKIAGAIVGRAIYENKIDLRAAIRELGENRDGL